MSETPPPHPGRSPRSPKPLDTSGTGSQSESGTALSSRVRVDYDPAYATAYFIGEILESARRCRKDGPVAKHLVGAALALRFVDKKIANRRFTVFESQTGFRNDFKVGTTVFHVTVAPTALLFETLKRDLKDGVGLYLLVPENIRVGVEQIAEDTMPGRIAVTSIEVFVANTLEWMSGYDGRKLRSELRKLLDKYNTRASAVEPDRSILIDIPPNLD